MGGVADRAGWLSLQRGSDFYPWVSLWEQTFIRGEGVGFICIQHRKSFRYHVKQGPRFNGKPMWVYCVEPILCSGKVPEDSVPKPTSHCGKLKIYALLARRHYPPCLAFIIVWCMCDQPVQPPAQPAQVTLCWGSSQMTNSRIKVKDALLLLRKLPFSDVHVMHSPGFLHFCDCTT